MTISAAPVVDLVGFHGQSIAQGINGASAPQPDFPIEYADGLPAHLPTCWYRRWITGTAHWASRKNTIAPIAPYVEHSVQWENRITHGFELGCADALMSAGRIAAVCKVAQGSTGIDEWDPEGSIFEELIAVYKGGNASVLDDDGAECLSFEDQLRAIYGADVVFRHHIVWAQGETDAETNELADAYEAKFSALCTAFFAVFPDARIWISPLHPDVVRSPDNAIATINTAFANVAASDPTRIVVVENSDIVSPLQSDAAHWQCWASNEMGRRIAQEILAA